MLKPQFILILLYGVVNFAIADDVDIVIVGAGASGISAATRLLKQVDWNWNFVVLEAKNRIGGRVNTVDFGKLFTVLLIIKKL